MALFQINKDKLRLIKEDKFKVTYYSKDKNFVYIFLLYYIKFLKHKILKKLKK